MTLSRQQRHHQAACARYNAGKNKPLERRRVQSFLSPIPAGANPVTHPAKAPGRTKESAPLSISDQKDTTANGLPFQTAAAA